MLKLHGKEHITTAVPTDCGRTLLSLGYEGRLAECHVDLEACDGAVRLEVVLGIALPTLSLASRGSATAAPRGSGGSSSPGSRARTSSCSTTCPDGAG